MVKTITKYGNCYAFFTYDHKFACVIKLLPESQIYPESGGWWILLRESKAL